MLGKMNLNIEGIKLTELKKFSDKKGEVLHFINKNSASFKNFAEVYFSKIKPGVIKGWKCHKLTTQNICVPNGEIKFVLYDNREFSNSYKHFDELILNNIENYFLLTIPPNIWYSFKCVSKEQAILSNLIDITHDPNECLNLEIKNSTIPFTW
tara:strand:- start:57 stop:515 length:459 start_codon:yes stop_codon:yes gene_type:complete